MRTRKIIILSLIILVLGLTIGIYSCDEKVTRLEANWAAPISSQDLGNFYKVTDNFYRGAQPSAAGMKELKQMGIKTIINLREHHSDRDELEGLDLGYEHIKINTWNLKDEQVIKFLKLITDKEKYPIFLHCKHGSDRTGTMTAMYRITIQGWTKQEAIAEMTEGPYGFHSVFSNLVKYINAVDVEYIKKQAGIK